MVSLSRAFNGIFLFVNIYFFPSFSACLERVGIRYLFINFSVLKSHYLFLYFMGNIIRCCNYILHGVNNSPISSLWSEKTKKVVGDIYIMD